MANTLSRYSKGQNKAISSCDVCLYLAKFLSSCLYVFRQRKRTNHYGRKIYIKFSIPVYVIIFYEVRNVKMVQSTVLKWQPYKETFNERLRELKKCLKVFGAYIPPG